MGEIVPLYPTPDKKVPNLQDEGYSNNPENSEEILNRILELSVGIGVEPIEFMKLNSMIVYVSSLARDLKDKFNLDRYKKTLDDLNNETLTVLLKYLMRSNEKDWELDLEYYKALFEVINARMTKIHRENNDGNKGA
ncbi:hypothetical protein K9M41_00405 [Candidatus Gracilibacteria bacterium]|nr:hypothetical protein [Candidatus Gracilibacteria bacterium]